MVDLFISYSRRDQAMVARIAHAIEREGYAVWWDAELPPHQSYGDVITAKIAEAAATLVVWSNDAVKSEWVRAEADMARNQRKLIQTSLDNVMPPLPFNQIQYAELGGWQGEADHPGWRKVRRSLADLCGPRDGTGESAPAFAAAAYPPPREEQPAAAARTKWPLFAGIGIGVVALAAAGGIVIGQRGAAPVAAPVVVESAAAPAEPVPAAPAAVEAVPSAEALAASAPVDEDGVPIEPNPADMTIPDSSTRLIAVSEIASMGPSTLKVARGEILARKGARFRDPWLTDWFNRYAWYKPRFDRVPLSDIEKRNIALIRQAEARYGQ